ncbi:MAG TPA: DUF4124 domain-containing protein [Xanthomonadaceae bacterium]|nr:DUF4124 domain-containing protein [Xanthomonadaceae bacterium]
MVRLLCLIALTLCVAFAAQATRFYKWVDEEGVVHYSDSPPAHGRYEQIETRDPASTFEELDALEDENSEGTEEEAQERPTRPPSPQSVAEARQINCQNARNNLDTLTSFDAIQMDLDGDGELETLTEAQVEEQVERMRAQIERFCDEG